MCRLIETCGRGVFPVYPPKTSEDGTVIAGEVPLLVFNSHVMAASINSVNLGSLPTEVIPMTMFAGQTFFIDAPVSKL